MSGGSQKQESGPTGAQIKAQWNQMNASEPILRLIAQQLQEALTTGGVGAQIPIAQRATEAGAKAASDTNASTAESLARAGVTGPYARQVQSGVEQKGAFDVSQITPQIIQMLLAMAPDFALMRGSPVFGTPKSEGSGWNFGI